MFLTTSLGRYIYFKSDSTLHILLGFFCSVLQYQFQHEVISKLVCGVNAAITLCAGIHVNVRYPQTHTTTIYLCNHKVVFYTFPDARSSVHIQNSGTWTTEQHKYQFTADAPLSL